MIEYCEVQHSIWHYKDLCLTWQLSCWFLRPIWGEAADLRDCLARFNMGLILQRLIGLPKRLSKWTFFHILFSCHLAFYVKRLSVKPLSIKPLSVKPLRIKPLSVKQLSIKPLSIKPISVKLLSIKPLSVKPWSIKLFSVKPFSIILQYTKWWRFCINWHPLKIFSSMPTAKTKHLVVTGLLLEY